MTKTINEHEGKKYLRLIHSADGQGQSINVDVYAVLKAFNVTCPAIAHAVKKLLCCGTRGKGDKLADLKGVEAAVARAIDLEQLEIQTADPCVESLRRRCKVCNNEIDPDALYSERGLWCASCQDYRQVTCPA